MPLWLWIHVAKFVATQDGRLVMGKLLLDCSWITVPEENTDSYVKYPSHLAYNIIIIITPYTQNRCNVHLW